MKFGYLILRQISKFVAIRGQIKKAKNAPNAISAGASSQISLGELTAFPFPDSLAGFKGPTSKEREGELGRAVNRRGEESGRRKRREQRGREEGDDRGREGGKGCPKQ